MASRNKEIMHLNWSNDQIEDRKILDQPVTICSNVN